MTQEPQYFFYSSNILLGFASSPQPTGYYFNPYISSIFFVQFCWQGHDHGHSHAPITQTQAENAALDLVLQLEEQGKIEASWKTVAVEKSIQMKFGDNLEWVISFKNEKIIDPSKQTLYVFMTMSGEYLAVNYTGK